MIADITVTKKLLNNYFTNHFFPKRNFLGRGQIIFSAPPKARLHSKISRLRFFQNGVRKFSAEKHKGTFTVINDLLEFWLNENSHAEVRARINRLPLFHDMSEVRRR